jgi:hypothetical protein
MSPSHAAATPIVARNAGIKVVAISWDQSLNKLAKPMPTTVRLSQRAGLAETWFIESQDRRFYPLKSSGWLVTGIGHLLIFPGGVSLAHSKAARGIGTKEFFIC